MVSGFPGFTPLFFLLGFPLTLSTACLLRRGSVASHRVMTKLACSLLVYLYVMGNPSHRYRLCQRSQVVDRDDRWSASTCFSSTANLCPPVISQRLVDVVGLRDYITIIFDG
ncbi:hypothetical protein EV401DRAFT_2034154 [Pisolithus croceorrhizus]|nr:hypothetical protein EV401DRAFT_2034154 [Pisolithus croceorrhizus]